MTKNEEYFGKRIGILEQAVSNFLSLMANDNNNSPYQRGNFDAILKNAIKESDELEYQYKDIL